LTSHLADYERRGQGGSWVQAFVSANGEKAVANTRKEELFEALIESSTDFAIFTIDSNGLVTGWNIGAERLFGYSEAEILGKSGNVIFIPEDLAKGAADEERLWLRLRVAQPMKGGISEVMGRDFGLPAS
jgi:PAS domain-containing protein